MSFSSAAGGIKNIAIGIGIIAGVGLALYVLFKAKQGAEKAVGYLGGSSNERTLGTDIYDATHDDSPNKPFDPKDPQAMATCLAIYPAGSGLRPKPGGHCELVLGKNWNAPSSSGS